MARIKQWRGLVLLSSSIIERGTAGSRLLQLSLMIKLSKIWTDLWSIIIELHLCRRNHTTKHFLPTQLSVHQSLRPTSHQARGVECCAHSSVHQLVMNIKIQYENANHWYVHKNAQSIHGIKAFACISSIQEAAVSIYWSCQRDFAKFLYSIY